MCSQRLMHEVLGSSCEQELAEVALHGSAKEVSQGRREGGEEDAFSC